MITLQTAVLLQALGVLSISCLALKFSQFEQAVGSSIYYYWPFREISSITDLKMSEEDVDLGTLKNGEWSKQSLARIFQKVIDGELLRVVVLGSSVSSGAELGFNNFHRTYHYGLAYWWNSTIGAATGSYMIIRQIGLGSAVTAYFSRCWNEYLEKDDDVDLVIWEFQLDDQPHDIYKDALTNFTLSMMQLDSHPSLIYINFYVRQFYVDYIEEIREKECENYQARENTTRLFLSPLKLTWLSLQKIFCNSREGLMKTGDVLYGTHPTFLAHAQMSYLLINHLQAQFQEFDEAMKTGRFSLPSQNDAMSYYYGMSAKFVPLKPSHHLVCWTAIQGDYRVPQKHSLFNLVVAENSGFDRIDRYQRQVSEVRYDSVGGYESLKGGSHIVFKLNFKHFVVRRIVTISVVFKNKYFAGRVKVTLRNEGKLEDYSVREGDVSDKDGIALSVLEIATVVPGNYLLTVDCIDRGAVITSISLKYTFL